MSIMNKPDLAIFAQDAKTGEIDSFPDILRGWGVTLDRTAGKPPLEWFNAIGKRTDEWLMYLTQRGVAEWDTTLSYPKTAIVQFDSVVYVSIKETKGEQPDKSQAAWSTLGLYLGLENYATNAALTNGLNTKLNTNSVAQATGTSTTNVMSQDAATKAFMKIGDFGVGSPIPLSSESLNTVVKYGVYIQSYVSNATTERDYPYAGAAGTLTVIPTSDEKSLQEFKVYNNASQIYCRIVSSKGNDFGKPWIQMATTTAIDDAIKKCESKMFAVDQSLTEMTTERFKGITYTNDTDKPREVMIITRNVSQSQEQRALAYINGNLIIRNVYNSTHFSPSISFIVPTRGTYMVEIDQGIEYWLELK